MTDITKPETGNKFAKPWPPSWSSWAESWRHVDFSTTVHSHQFSWYEHPEDLWAVIFYYKNSV